MIKIVTVVGARPQFVKAAIVSHALRASGGIQEILVHTGQHYDHEMSGSFFDELGIAAPDYNLGIGSGCHGQQTGRALEKVEEVLLSCRPAAMLVYGDTNSTLAGALAACKLHIPVAHVEAGLRSFNRSMPEEINRVLTDHVSSLLFAPTDLAVANLAREGISGPSVVRVGDVMFDAALHYGAISSRIPLPNGGCDDRFALMTIHRAENTDDTARLFEIVEFAEMLAENEMNIVWPVHPRTVKALEKIGRQKSRSARLRMVAPVGFLQMIALEKAASLIITDSGGVQKEAYFHKRPCLVVRRETEWRELLDCGAAVLADPERGASQMLDLARAALGATPAYGQLYGDGKASVHVADHLRRFLQSRRSDS